MGSLRAGPGQTPGCEPGFPRSSSVSFTPHRSGKERCGQTRGVAHHSPAPATTGSEQEGVQLSVSNPPISVTRTCSCEEIQGTGLTPATGIGEGTTAKSGLALAFQAAASRPSMPSLRGKQGGGSLATNMVQPASQHRSATKASTNLSPLAFPLAFPLKIWHLIEGKMQFFSNCEKVMHIYLA